MGRREPPGPSGGRKGTSMLDLRFSSALKAMLLLAMPRTGSPVLTSSQLARSLNTNPSLVRKLMVPLCRTLWSRPSRPRRRCPPRPVADQITLGEIYRSSIGDKPLWAPRPEGPRECLVTKHSAEYFVRLTDETEAAVLGALAAAPSPTASTSCAPSTGPTVLPLRNVRSPRPVISVSGALAACSRS